MKTKWGIWHETGHLYQDGDWTFNSTGEVTVNLFSLNVQAAFGQPLRIFERDKENPENKPDVEKAKIFLKSPGHDFLDEEKFADMFFIRLVMFQQLRQHFGKEFYVKLFQYYRSNPLNVNDAGEDSVKVQKFIQRSCKVSKTNLISFYKQWGLPISDETLNEVNKLKLQNPTTDISKIFMQ